MFRLVASVFALCTCAASAAQAQTPQSYPLICRGGPSMRIVTSHDVPDGVTARQNTMRVFFRAGAAPGNPGPGECVWMDRGLRPGEPENFWIRGDVEFAFQVMGDGRLNREGRDWRLSAEGSGAEAAGWNRIVRAVLAGGTFTLDVYNADGRTMAVTRLH